MLPNCTANSSQLQQGGTIGITLHGNWSESWDEDDPEDQEAAERAREFENTWFADSLYRSGDYPASMRAQVDDRLPRFTPEESKLVLGSSDFYGMNSYTAFFVPHKDTPPDINATKAMSTCTTRTVKVSLVVKNQIHLGCEWGQPAFASC
ncbi:glycoside hydrolase superfamily [Aspergillus egyptiacus]|nr:glycoside hydrolase superfamily [Aspergillus egyptiacus]